MRYKKLKYETITRRGEYEQQCEMEVIYTAWKVGQINDYLFKCITSQIQYKLAWMKKGEW